MKTKLAGMNDLRDLVAATIAQTREKLAADDSKGEKGDKEKKPSPFEKKDRPAASKEEKDETEKKSSAIDPSNPEEVEKLAAALDEVAETLVKEADKVDLGGESKQGGEVVPNGTPVGGTQPYKKDKAHHQPPAPGVKSTKDNPGPATAMKTDDERAPGGNGAKYPANGVLRKTGSAEVEKVAAGIANRVGKHLESVGKGAFGKVMRTGGAEKAMNPATARRIGAGVYGGGAAATAAAGIGAKKAVDKVRGKEKSAAEEILAKVAEFHGGGETLDDKKAPVPSNAGRELIANNTAPVNAKRVDAKAQPKKDLKEVLTEPALTKSTDSKVHENLRNATKGGVKIAAARALIEKVASEGCKCEGSGSCAHCKVKKAHTAMKAGGQVEA